MTSTAGTKRKAQSPRTIPIAAYESLEQLAQMWKGKAREKDLLPLLKQGYVVVRKVIPLTDIAKWKKETEKVVSILDACAAAHAKEETKNKDRDPDETESDKEMEDEPVTTTSLLSRMGMHGIQQNTVFGHLRAQHEARCHPALTALFAQVWDCKEDDLLTSNDALCYGKPAKAKAKGWAHFDMKFYRAGTWCIQGQVPLTKQNVDLGCLRVREGSHLGFRDFCDKAERFETLKNRTGDWCMLNKEELDKHFPQDKYPIVNVESEPGDVVLWFSHTLHEGQVPREPGADPRLVFYICQVPRFHVPQSHYDVKTQQLRPLLAGEKKKHKEKLEGKLVKKRVHFLMRRMTSHCPDEPHTFGILPRTYGDKKFEAILQAFSNKVEEAGLGSVPFLLPKSESGGQPKKKKSKSDCKDEKKKKPPLFVTLPHLLQAVAQVEAGVFVPSDDVLPQSLRNASAEMKRRLWLLNGF